MISELVGNVKPQNIVNAGSLNILDSEKIVVTFRLSRITGQVVAPVRCVASYTVSHEFESSQC